MSFSLLREKLLIFIPGMLLVVGAFWATFQFMEPAPPAQISITTGGLKGAYYAYGKSYAEILKNSGIQLELKSSAGSLQNLQRLSGPQRSADLALLQGGISNNELSPDLRSLGRVFLEPIWVFYREDLDIRRLTDLTNKRIAIGAPNSGTRQLASQLLEVNGINGQTATLLDYSGEKAIAAVENGTADAAFFVVAPRSELLKGLLRKEGLKLMNFDRADAYTRRFPFLETILLPQGAIDFKDNVPAQDVQLVATSAAVVMHKDFHPALAGLMVEVLKKVHAKGDMFQKLGQFPQVQDPEFKVTDDTQRAYKDGVPFLQRYLPFWLASFLQRMFLLLLPIATVLFPVFKLGPMLYNWRVRNKILQWYIALKDLEQNINLDTTHEHFETHKTELERIEKAVRAIQVPKDFSDQFYHLRGAVGLVRKRLLAEGKTS